MIILGKARSRFVLVAAATAGISSVEGRDQARGADPDPGHENQGAAGRAGWVECPRPRSPGTGRQAEQARRRWDSCGPGEEPEIWTLSVERNLRRWERRNASVVVDLWGAWGRRTAGRPRRAVARTRRGRANVRAAGLFRLSPVRAATGRGRRAAGVGRPPGAPAGARGGAALAGRPAPARGRDNGRAVRNPRSGSRGI